MREEHECDCCDAQAPPEVLAKNCFLARDAYDHVFTMFLCASCRAGWKWEWHQAPNPQEIYAAFHPSPNDSTGQHDQGISFDETANRNSEGKRLLGLPLVKHDQEYRSMADTLVTPDGSILEICECGDETCIECPVDANGFYILEGEELERLLAERVKLIATCTRISGGARDRTLELELEACANARLPSEFRLADETAWKASLRQSTGDAGVEMDDTEFDAFTQVALEHGEERRRQ
jgi:hypothetical protein